VKSASLLVQLESLGPASAADLADALECSHQLVLQKTPKLIEIGVIARVPCPDDARRKLFLLTPAGHEQLAILRSLAPEFVAAYEELERSVGDLHTVLKEAIAALQHRPLIERMGGRRSR